MSLTSTGNVLLVTFGDDPGKDNNAYQALTDLGALNSQRQIAVEAATVITREPDGNVTVKSQVGDNPLEGTAIGGPLGMLVGGWTGVLIGSVFDIDDVDTTESVLAEYSKKVQPGRTAVLVEATEQSPEVVDSAMAKLGGEVTRRPVYEIEGELAAAEEAERKAKFEARKELHRARVAEHKAEAHAKVEALKDKLPRPKAGAAA